MKSLEQAMTRPLSTLWNLSFVLVLVATFFYFITIGVLLPTLPIYVHHGLLSDEVGVGLAIGAFGLAALLSRPLAGFIGDRRGRRPLLVAGALIVALSVASYTFTTTLTLLIVARVLTGLGEALFFVGALAMVSDLAPVAQRGKALTIFTIALYAALTVGPIIGEAALKAHGYAAVWAIGAGSALAAMLVSLGLRETKSTNAPTSMWRWAHPAALLPGVILLTSVWGLTAFNTFVAIHMQGLGMVHASPLFAVFALVLLAVRSLAPGIPDRVGPARTAGLALAFSCTGMAALAISTETAAVFGGTAVFAVGQALAFPALTAMSVTRVPPHERGAVLATFSGFLDLGFWLGPMVLGVVAVRASIDSVFAVSAVVAAVGLVILVIVDRYGGARILANWEVRE